GVDNVLLLVGDDTDLLEVDPDIGQVFGDEADVLVLGPAGQDLVADDQNTRRDDLAHDFSPPVPVPCASNALKSRGFAAEISTRQPFFRAARRITHTKCCKPMHIALARPLLPSLQVMHCVTLGIFRIYGSCLRRNEWPRRGSPPGLSGALPLAQGDAAGRPGISPAGGGTAVPPDRHHLRRLWRRRSPGTADPL